VSITVMAGLAIGREVAKSTAFLLSLTDRDEVPLSAKSGRLSLEVINQWSSACLFHFCSF